MPRSVSGLLIAILATALTAAHAEAQPSRQDTPPALMSGAALPPPFAGAPDPLTDLDIRQGNVRARAFLGLRDYRSARAEVAIILAARPDEVSALRTRASIEEATGRWRHAVNDWARVATLTKDAAAADRRVALLRANPSYADVTGFFEGAAGSDEMHGVRLGFASRPLDGPEWSVTLEQRSAHADERIRLDGTVGAIDASRSKIDVEIADTLVVGRLSGRLIATDDAVGAGAGFQRRRPWGFVEAAAVYQAPYWAYASAVERAATTDNVGIAGETTRGRWTVRGRFAIARYSVSDQDDVARSTRVVLGSEYALGEPGAPAPWRLVLGVDREAFSSVRDRQRPGGARFSPIEAVDRTILSAGAAKTFRDSARRHATIGVGYRRDAESGTQGPYALVLAEAPISRDVCVGLRAEYSDVSTRGASTKPYGFAEIYLRRTF